MPESVFDMVDQQTGSVFDSGSVFDEIAPDDTKNELTQAYAEIAHKAAANAPASDENASLAALNHAAEYAGKLAKIDPEMSNEELAQKKESMRKLAYGQIRAKNIEDAKNYIQNSTTGKIAENIAYGTKLVPIARQSFELLENEEIKSAHEAFQKGEANSEHYRMLGTLAAREEAENGKGGLRKFMEKVAGVAGSVAEFATIAKALPMPAALAGRAGVGGFAARAAYTGLGTTAIGAPLLTVTGAQRRQIQDHEGFGTAYGKELLSNTITNTIFAGSNVAGSNASKEFLGSILAGKGTAGVAAKGIAAGTARNVAAAEVDHVVQQMMGLQPESALSKIITGDNKTMVEGIKELSQDTAAMAIVEGMMHARDYRGAKKEAGVARDELREFSARYMEQKAQQDAEARRQKMAEEDARVQEDKDRLARYEAEQAAKRKEADEQQYQYDLQSKGLDEEHAIQQAEKATAERRAEEEQERLAAEDAAHNAELPPIFDPTTKGKESHAAFQNFMEKLVGPYAEETPEKKTGKKIAPEEITVKRTGDPVLDSVADAVELMWARRLDDAGRARLDKYINDQTPQDREKLRRHISRYMQWPHGGEAKRMVDKAVEEAAANAPDAPKKKTGRKTVATTPEEPSPAKAPKPLTKITDPVEMAIMSVLEDAGKLHSSDLIDDTKNELIDRGKKPAPGDVVKALNRLYAAGHLDKEVKGPEDHDSLKNELEHLMELRAQPPKPGMTKQEQKEYMLLRAETDQAINLIRSKLASSGESEYYSKKGYDNGPIKRAGSTGPETPIRPEGKQGVHPRSENAPVADADQGTERQASQRGRKAEAASSGNENASRELTHDDVLREIDNILSNPPNARAKHGMADIDILREAIRKKFGDKEASKEVLYEMLQDMRRDRKIRMVAIGDASEYTSEQLASLPQGVNEIFGSLERGEKAPEPKKTGKKPVEPASQGKGKTEIDRLNGLVESFQKKRDAAQAELERSFPSGVYEQQGAKDRKGQVDDYDAKIAQVKEMISNLGGDPDVLHAPPAGAGSTGQGEGTTTPYDIINFIRKQMGLPTYGVKKGAALAYDVKSGGVTLPAERANDARNILHELGHDASIAGRVDLDPNSMPQSVREGFREFDYVKNRPDARAAMKEGFSEWLARRANSDLNNLTPNQAAAADYAERMLRGSKGGESLMSKMDRIRDMFTDLNSRSASSRAGDVSAPLKNMETPAERTQGWFRNAIDTAHRVLADSLAGIKRAEGTSKQHPGSLLSAYMANDKTLSRARMERYWHEGFYAYDENGKQLMLSESPAKLLESLSEQDQADVHTLMLARDLAHKSKRPGVAEARKDQLALDREFLKELNQDPQRAARLGDASDRFTKILNGGLMAMVYNGQLTKAQADQWIKDNPFYISTKPVSEHDWFDAGWDPFKKSTGMSSEQKISLKEALFRRMELVSKTESTNRKFQLAYELAQQPGAAKWIGKDFVEATGSKAQFPSDPTKATISGRINGEVKYLRVNDRDFYDAYQGTPRWEWINTLGAASGFFGRVTSPVARVAHTVLDPVWQMKNMMFRDVVQWTQNTTNELGLVRNIADFYKWSAGGLGFFGQAAYKGGADKVDANSPMMRAIQLYEQATGGGTISGGENIGGRVEPHMISGTGKFIKRLLDFMGGPEKSIRAKEFYDVLKKQGITDEMMEEGLSTIPFPVLNHALDVSAQATHNTHIRGELIEQLGHGVPFLGAHFAGIYKSIQSAGRHPERLAYLAGFLALEKLTEFALYHDDPEWSELPLYARVGFNFKTPLGWINIAPPRNIPGYFSSFNDTGLRWLGKNNPHVADQIKHQVLDTIAPNAFPTLLQTGGQIITNRDSFGRPIVPDRVGDKTSLMGRFTTPEAISHAAGNFGGKLPAAASKAILGDQEGAARELERAYNPLKADQSPRQSLFDYRDRVMDMEREFERKQMADKTGLKVIPSPELKMARKFAEHIAKLEKEYHLDRTTDQRKIEIRSQQLKLAQEGLKKLP